MRKEKTDPYTNLNANRWSDTAILAPGCIFEPRSAQQVSEGVEVLTSIRNDNAGCKFSVKSGGHMAIPGANNINTGVSIDLGRLNDIILSDERSFVRLGAGGTWAQAYAAFENTDIAFPGGVCGTTGVGGVSLGGGMSLFQPRVGWVVDNILNFEVVLSSGSLVNANKTHNTDLFRALKGGGNNFGIITHIDLAVFESKEKVWGGQILVPAIRWNVDRALRGITEFTKANNDDVNAALQLAFQYSHSGLSFVDIAPATTNGTVNPPIFNFVNSMWPRLRNTMKLRSLSDLVREIDTVQPKGFRYAT
jgi:FAD/FMN-containing dehydrogenase